MTGATDTPTVGQDFQHSLPPQHQPDSSLLLVARHLIREACKDSPSYGNVVREARVALAALQDAPPAPDDRLTGGAPLRDYFAAQALRSHYIISRTEGKTVAYLVDLCDEIADEFMSRPSRRR